MKKGLKQAKFDQLQLSFLAKICVLENKLLNEKSVELHFQQLFGQFLRDHSEKCPKLVIFNCHLWLKDAS